MASNDDPGTVREVDNGYELRFERRFEQPVEEVWRAITEPDQLREWIGEAEIDLRPGGRIRIDGPAGAAIDGEVLEVKDPEFLSFKWDSRQWGDGGPVRFELSQDEHGGTLLVFTHVAPRTALEEFRRATLAGWPRRLALLGSALAARMPAGPTARGDIHLRYAGSAPLAGARR